MKSAYLRTPRAKSRLPVSQVVTLPAPVGGWSTSEALSATSPATAQVLENWRPTTTGIAMRGGSRTHATVSLTGLPVVSLMNFNGAAMKRMFAATATSVFDVTAPVSQVAEVAPAVTGQTSGYYSFVNFTTAGGSFLVAVNGTDPLLLYDPATGWKKITDTSSPAITGISSTALLSFVFAYRSRLFFIERESLRVKYLPVGSIAGALESIDLSGFFQRGGKILFGATWSMDAGDGLDDKCVFVTSEGEVAVFEGANPSSVGDWTQVGRYDIGRPLGPRATMRAGGDLLIATEEGLVPLSAAVSKDITALNFGAMSQPISPDWRREAIARRLLPWEIVKWPAQSYAIVSTPVTLPSQSRISFVVNTVTGKWSKYTGWDTRCMILHDDRLFFGTNDGRVKQAEIGGTDDGTGIYYLAISNPEHLGAPGVTKTIRQARALYTGRLPFIDQVSASMNYVVDIPSPPPSIQMADGGNLWDLGNWDQATWDAPKLPFSVQAEWKSIGVTGHAMQWQVQVTGGLTAMPDTEMVSIDISFQMGGTIV